MSYRIVKLSDVVTINPKTITSTFSSDEDVAFIAMADVSEEGKLENVQTRTFEDVKKGYTCFQNGDVLLAKITPCFENGKATIVDSLFSEIGFGSTEFHVLRPTQEMDGRFLFHLIWNENFRRAGANRMTGSAGQKRVPTLFLENYEIKLPPLEEQKRIAAILDKADSLRRKRAEAIALADDFLRAAFLEMFGDPVTNPKGWPTGTIRDLVSTVNYGTSEKADEVNGEYPILRMMNITYAGRWDFTSLKYIDLSEKDKEKYLTQKGDLLFNRTNSKELVGKTAVFEKDMPMAIAGYLIRVRTNEKANPYYISAYLNSEHGKQTLMSMCKSIVGMANINAQELQNIKIAIPPKDLQDKYAKIIGAMRSRESKMITSAEKIALLNSSLNATYF